MNSGDLNIFFQPKHRNVVLSIFGGLTLLLLLIAYQLYEDYRSNIKQVESNATNWTQLLEQHATATFHKIDATIRGANNIIEAKGNRYKWSRKSYHQLLVSMATQTPEIKAMKILNQDGYYLGESDNDGPLPITTNSDRKYFIEQKNNPKAGLVISDPVVSKTSGVWVIVLSRRIFSASNEFKGLILATVSLDYFENFYSKLKLGEHGNVTLISYKNHILMARYPRKVDQLGQELMISPNLKKAFEANEAEGLTQSISTVDRIEKTFAFKKSSSFNFIVITGLATIDYIEAWRTRLFYMIIGGIFVLINFVFLLKRFLQSADRTEIQKMQLAESAKMSTLGEMASGIAHEINNPLAIIGGRSQTIYRLLSQQHVDFEQVKKLLASIDDTVRRIAIIINGLRTFSRQADEDPMLAVSLEQIVKNSLSLCSEKFKKNNINLVIETIPEVLIFCRETQISQVLLNLLSNAFDAAEDQSDKWVKLRFKINLSKVQICISNSGTGIPPEIAQKMFQPFFTTKPIGKGTGLGLSISKGIIESHKGRFFLNNSSLNTEFIVELSIV